MIRYLHIERLAVIDRLESEFGPGLSVLTGETGAGKSILVEAVGAQPLISSGPAQTRPASRLWSKMATAARSSSGESSR